MPRTEHETDIVPTMSDAQVIVLAEPVSGLCRVCAAGASFRTAFIQRFLHSTIRPRPRPGNGLPITRFSGGLCRHVGINHLKTE